MQIRVAETKTSLWVQATEVVKDKFRSSYAASVEPNPQYFAVTQDQEDRILACAGITFADHRILFSEQYLAQPIEEILSQRFEKTIERSNIVEIGNLVSHHLTAGMILVNMIPLLSWCMGGHYLLCTVTPRVRQMMESCQIDFEPLLTADPTRLADDGGKNWGTYYAKKPITGFIRVDPKRSRFAATTLNTSFTQLPGETLARAQP
ncbi:thermostable hemolysin [Pseudomonas citri]|uniref:thermostable hemolysin n=1 Tax=Pseudomonas citri TaxID=2978349 RepID=UPI0021B50FBF|nr:thermostable hemolysin [Pseudomonas citri]